MHVERRLEGFALVTCNRNIFAFCQNQRRKGTDQLANDVAARGENRKGGVRERLAARCIDELQSMVAARWRSVASVTFPACTRRSALTTEFVLLVAVPCPDNPVVSSSVEMMR